MLTRRTNQGGSVTTFVVIGVILIFGLIGTVYFVNQRAQQARKEQSIAATEKEKANKAPVKSSESTKPAGESNTSKVPVTESEGSSSSSDLPATGPNSSLVELIGIYSITMAVVAYAMSLRKLSRSL